MINLIEKKGIMIAVICGAIATALTFMWLKQQEQSAQEQGEQQGLESVKNTIEAVFARMDIPSGRVITEDMVGTKLVNKNSISASTARSIERVLDKISSVPIRKDTPIPLDKLSWPTAQDASLSTKVPIGKRAMAVSVDNISSLLGMMKPGDYVDVLGLIPLPVQVEGKQSAQPANVPLFQNVLVLAVGSHFGQAAESAPGGRRRAATEEPQKEGAPLITLALTPEEANILAFVQEQGKIRLILRSPGDSRTEPVQPASWETVLKYVFPNADLTVKEQKPKEPEKEAPQVEVIRGFKKEMVPLTQNK